VGQVDENGVAYKIILVRHGESQWNVENRFTGWVDVPLAETGVAESHRAASVIKEEKLEMDVVYTSVLKRAIKTGMNIVEDLDMMHVPFIKDWRLNERHYGALQGLNKAETVEKHGADQVNVWRRSYDIPPPEMDESHEFWPGKEPKYACLAKEQLPKTESLKIVVDRFMPLWQDEMVPAIKSGKRLMVAAHGNTLRALVKHLDDIPEDKITVLNIPTAVPLVYELDINLKPVKSARSWAPLSGYYLGDQEEIRKAIDGVQAQTGGAAAAPAAEPAAAEPAAAEPAATPAAAPAAAPAAEGSLDKSLPSVVSWTMYR
jgi:2,3-bisphosphoglycerate-dependent phosphoglycerate mutase